MDVQRETRLSNGHDIAASEPAYGPADDPTGARAHRPRRCCDGTDLTDFVVSHAYEAARRVLADRDRFELDPPVLEAWEALNARPARELSGLRKIDTAPLAL